MSDPFHSSDEFADRAHELYNAGRYDEAVLVLREGLAAFPYVTELHVGMGYAQLAREEYAWARESFEQALNLDSNNEDALSGLGETLLKLGQRTTAIRCFDLVLALGFRDDHDLMLQIGRALFREGLVRHAYGFFEIAVHHHEDSPEACVCLGYAAHRLRDEDEAVYWLRRGLDLEEHHAEARIYLANLLYDRGEYEAALFHFEQTEPADHLDDLAIWRAIELKKSVYRLQPTDPELLPWHGRLAELAAALNPVDRLLAEVEARQPDGSIRDPRQLELFGAFVSELQGMRRRMPGEQHRVRTAAGVTYSGTWEEIVFQMKMDDREGVGASLVEYMRRVSNRSRDETGFVLPATDPQSFVQGAAAAGLLKILR